MQILDRLKVFYREFIVTLISSGTNDAPVVEVKKTSLGKGLFQVKTIALDQKNTNDIDLTFPMVDGQILTNETNYYVLRQYEDFIEYPSTTNLFESNYDPYIIPSENFRLGIVEIANGDGNEDIQFYTQSNSFILNELIGLFSIETSFRVKFNNNFDETNIKFSVGFNTNKNIYALETSVISDSFLGLILLNGEFFLLLDDASGDIVNIPTGISFKENNWYRLVLTFGAFTDTIQLLDQDSDDAINRVYNADFTSKVVDPLYFQFYLGNYNSIENTDTKLNVDIFNISANYN